ncbi:phospholipid/cholesterol/gamma-HCH transport system permease protein [Roseiarcus fermentans]|uniref:Phospholipid/cholesterol/gamma-HCH transport system permease protein n=1 Tax=Roseiarcus fermentans TaxID=1473586 RepID=A0A366EVZ1_9HYPH|nr:phospholipid/cholesterol/gamma-HCH transport system permease protein [Roseiarcus fermentans]
MSVGPSVVRDVEGDELVLSLSGDWTVANSAALEATADSLIEPARKGGDAILDLAGVNRMDTAGAWAIDRARAELAEAGVRASYRGARSEYAVLLKEAGYQPIEPPKPTHAPTAISLLSEIGESVYTAGHDLAEGVSFFGEMVAMTVRLLPFPHRWRWTSMTYHLENYSLRSVPIIVLINFLVGAIVMQQGIFQLNAFGASAYAVNLVGVLGLRELALLMTAIMIAGRTGSAITAEIGSMAMHEEIDALRVMALDPLEVLIMPRLVALVIALPALTFLADLAELAGGLLVSWLYAGMTPIVFITRLHNSITTDTFLVGLIKAPFMAITIGIIAGVEGMDVRGSAESLGANVTASVVKSIFMVIVLDGLFAMFFSAVNY